MIFEFDPAKSEANKIKHGIDFEEAQLLWEDNNFLEAPARTMDEPRMIVIGDKHWSAIYTYRDGATRIISVRRARKEEVFIYENA
jgi:uncharacterized protein